MRNLKLFKDERSFMTNECPVMTYIGSVEYEDTFEYEWDDPGISSVRPDRKAGKSMRKGGENLILGAASAGGNINPGPQTYNTYKVVADYENMTLSTFTGSPWNQLVSNASFSANDGDWITVPFDSIPGDWVLFDSGTVLDATAQEQTYYSARTIEGATYEVSIKYIPVNIQFAPVTAITANGTTYTYDRFEVFEADGDCAFIWKNGNDEVYSDHRYPCVGEYVAGENDDYEITAVSRGTEAPTQFYIITYINNVSPAGTQYTKFDKFYPIAAAIEETFVLGPSALPNYPGLVFHIERGLSDNALEEGKFVTSIIPGVAYVRGSDNSYYNEPSEENFTLYLKYYNRNDELVGEKVTRKKTLTADQFFSGILDVRGTDLLVRILSGETILAQSSLSTGNESNDGCEILVRNFDQEIFNAAKPGETILGASEQYSPITDYFTPDTDNCLCVFNDDANGVTVTIKRYTKIA